MTISHFMQCFLVCLAMWLLLILQLLPSLEWRKKKKLITWTSCVWKKKKNQNVPVFAPNILILPNLHPLLMKWHKLSLIPTCARPTPVNTPHFCHIRGVTENITDLNYIYLKLPLVNMRPTTASLLIHCTNKCVCLRRLECCNFCTTVQPCQCWSCQGPQHWKQIFHFFLFISLKLFFYVRRFTLRTSKQQTIGQDAVL